MRYTKENIQKILDANEGFMAETYYKSRNFEESNQYKIHDGKMYRRAVDETSWADSKYDEKTICDIEQTRRVLKRYEHKLNLDF